MEPLGQKRVRRFPNFHFFPLMLVSLTWWFYRRELDALAG
jgi:hypothetical protein